MVWFLIPENFWEDEYMDDNISHNISRDIRNGLSRELPISGRLHARVSLGIESEALIPINWVSFRVRHTLLEFLSESILIPKNFGEMKIMNKNV